MSLRSLAALAALASLICLPSAYAETIDLTALSGVHIGALNLELEFLKRPTIEISPSPIKNVGFALNFQVGFN